MTIEFIDDRDETDANRRVEASAPVHRPDEIPVAGHASDVKRPLTGSEPFEDSVAADERNLGFRSQFDRWGGPRAAGCKREEHRRDHYSSHLTAFVRSAVS